MTHNILICLSVLLCIVWAGCSMPNHTTNETLLRSSDLGWTPGQDVTDAFAAAIRDGRIGPGSELLVEARYEVSDTIELPDNVTLSAVNRGGFDVTHFEPQGNQVFLRLGNNNTLRNLTIKYIGTPEPERERGPTNPTAGEHYYRGNGLQARGRSNIRLEHCRFVGSIGNHLHINDGSGLDIIGTHFVGGFWTVTIASYSDITIRNSVFEKGQGDGIKTIRGSNRGVENVIVENCVFQDNARDGIDTTGGFKDVIIRDTIFRRLFTGLDIKSPFFHPDDLDAPVRNENMRIENCRFTDIRSAITLTTLDRGWRNDHGQILTAENVRKHAPQRIRIVDTIIESTDGSPMRMLLVKGAHSIHYDNVRFLGDEIEEYELQDTYEIFGDHVLHRDAAEALNDEIGGTLGEPGRPGPQDDTSIPFDVGPRDE